MASEKALKVLAVRDCGSEIYLIRIIKHFKKNNMKIIFKILVSPFIFILTAIMYLFPLNVFSYFTAIFGIVSLFKHLFYSLMKWENKFDYPFFDHFRNPIHNYLAGATIHIWFPFHNTYLFLFNEDEFRYNEFSF